MSFRVVTANVNGIRATARRGGLEWLAENGADVICLQEVRATTDQLMEVLIQAMKQASEMSVSEMSGSNE